MQPLSPDRTEPQDLEQRRQVALMVAAACDRLLRDRFGATDVHLFGSLAGQNPWHWDSDVDLAVAGLSFETWLAASDAVQAIAPPWLPVELVRLETVYPAVRDRIFQVAEPSNRNHPMTDTPYLTLKSHLEDELRSLERTFVALEQALEQASQVPEDFAIRTLASYLNDLYRRCERISERVAVALDGGLPQGRNWHQALLQQVAEPGGNGRPPLWRCSLLLDLDAYRRFRHIVHHKYGEDLRPDYVLELAEMAPPMQPKIQTAIAEFSQWLLDKSRE